MSACARHPNPSPAEMEIKEKEEIVKHLEEKDEGEVKKKDIAEPLQPR
jgi:hypothetical protein